MPVKLLTSGGGGVNLVPSSSIASDQTMYLPTSGTSGGTVLCTDSSGNLGLGVTPSAWWSQAKAIDLPGGSLWGAGNNNIRLAANAYYDGTGYKYRASSAAGLYEMYNNHTWFTAPSGTAGNAISFTQAMTLDASGNLGIGTSSPGAKLDVSGTSRQIFYVSGSDTEYRSVNGAGSAFAKQTYNALSYDWGLSNSFGKMTLDSSGNLTISGSTATKASGTTWANPSDQRLKDNIRDYEKGLVELMQVRVREWEYNGKGGTTEGLKGLGVVADEIETILPNTVETYEAKLEETDEEVTTIKKFDATEITWLLVNAVKELTQRIEALEYTKQGE